MNRQAAYKILSERLKYFGNRVNRKVHFDEEGRYEEYISQSGNTYKLGYEEKGAELYGQIHDNNSQQFVLLEERIAIEEP